MPDLKSQYIVFQKHILLHTKVRVLYELYVLLNGSQEKSCSESHLSCVQINSPGDLEEINDYKCNNVANPLD